MRTADKKITQTPEKRKTEKVTVNAERLAVRGKPALDGDLKKVVVKGAVLDKLGEVTGTGYDGEEALWIKVKGGYVKAEFVS